MEDNREEIAIDICMATFKRPELLANALESLARLDLRGARISVVVVDNDREETARATVDAFRRLAPFEVTYDVEPVQNIALARNRALEHVKGTYFAFIDDDETVSPEWLSNLLATMQCHHADAVFGPVEGLLPSDAPSWAKSQPCFRRRECPTGTRLDHGATNNVLVRRSAFAEAGQLFDPAFGLSGGEDADFFYRMHLAGGRLVWCNEAVVREHVPAGRLTLKWLRQRGFRGGQSYMRVFVRRYPPEKKAAWFLVKLLQIGAGVIAAPFVMAWSYPKYVRLTVRIMASLGQLSMVFNGAVYEEYRADRYVKS